MPLLYQLDRSLDGRTVDYPVPSWDCSVTVTKECEVHVRADDDGVGCVDLAYWEMQDGGVGRSVLIPLSEEEAKKLRRIGDRLLYCG